MTQKTTTTIKYNTTPKNDKKKAIIIYTALSFIILFVISLAIGTMINISPTAPQNDNQASGQTDEEDYYKNFISIDSQGVLDFLSAGATGFLYVGRPSCPNCTAFVPTLSAIIEENNYALIYYNTDAANSDPDKKAAALTAIDVSGVPSLMFIQEGQIIEKLSDRSKDSVKAFFDKYL